MYVYINKRSYAHLSAKYLIREEQRVPRLSGSQVAVIAYKHTHIYTQTGILLLNCFIFACLFFIFLNAFDCSFVCIFYVCTNLYICMSICLHFVCHALAMFVCMYTRVLSLSSTFDIYFFPKFFASSKGSFWHIFSTVSIYRRFVLLTFLFFINFFIYTSTYIHIPKCTSIYIYMYACIFWFLNFRNSCAISVAIPPNFAESLNADW